MHTTSPCPVGGTTLKTLNSKKNQSVYTSYDFPTADNQKKIKKYV